MLVLVLVLALALALALSLAACCLLLVACCLLLVPCSLFLVPCALFLVPCSLFLVPCSLFLVLVPCFLFFLSFFFPSCFSSFFLVLSFHTDKNKLPRFIRANTIFVRATVRAPSRCVVRALLVNCVRCGAPLCRARRQQVCLPFDALLACSAVGADHPKHAP